jgi:hypothetical protein
VNKRGHGFVVGIDAANGGPGLILQRSKGAPFVDRPFFLRAGAHPRQQQAGADDV